MHVSSPSSRFFLPLAEGLLSSCSSNDAACFSFFTASYMCVLFLRRFLLTNLTLIIYVCARVLCMISAIAVLSNGLKTASVCTIRSPRVVVAGPVLSWQKNIFCFVKRYFLDSLDLKEGSKSARSALPNLRDLVNARFSDAWVISGPMISGLNQPAQ